MLPLFNAGAVAWAAKIVLRRSFFPNRQKNLFFSQKKGQNDKKRGKKTRPTQLSGLVKQLKNQRIK